MQAKAPKMLQTIQLQLGVLPSQREATTTRRRPSAAIAAARATSRARLQKLERRSTLLQIDLQRAVMNTISKAMQAIHLRAWSLPVRIQEACAVPARAPPSGSPTLTSLPAALKPTSMHQTNEKAAQLRQVASTSNRLKRTSSMGQVACLTLLLQQARKIAIRLGRSKRQVSTRRRRRRRLITTNPLQPTRCTEQETMSCPRTQRRIRS